MEAIWKYPLALTDEQSLEIPAGYTPLAVQIQAGSLCLWCKVDPKNPKVPVVVHIYGTGHEHPHLRGTYVGTVQTGPLVWHVFVRCDAPI